MEWHRIAYHVPMVPLRIYSLICQNVSMSAFHFMSRIMSLWLYGDC